MDQERDFAMAGGPAEGMDAGATEPADEYANF